MTAAEEYQEATGDPGNPFDGAELVIYSADAEWAEEEPTHDNLRELGVASFSLWARFEEEKVEIPILGEASWHIWYSLSAESFQPDPAEPVSEAFVASIAQMVDEDVGEGWGDVERDVWDAMPDLEKYIFGLTRDAFLRQGSAEPGLVIDWCVSRYGGGAD